MYQIMVQKIKSPTPYVTQSDIVLVQNRSKSWSYNSNSDAWNKALLLLMLC